MIDRTHNDVFDLFPYLLIPPPMILLDVGDGRSGVRLYFRIIIIYKMAKILIC